MAKKQQKKQPTREQSWVGIETVPTPEHPPFPIPDGGDIDPLPLLHLLDRKKVAQIKVARLDLAISVLESQIKINKLERDLLKKAYKI